MHFLQILYINISWLVCLIQYDVIHRIFHCFLFSLTELGAQLETGIFVSRIIPGSACAREGNLAVGDRIISVSPPLFGRFIRIF